jgi:hypothetical protein
MNTWQISDINLVFNKVKICEGIQAAKGVGLKIQLRRHSWVQIPSLASIYTNIL